MTHPLHQETFSTFSTLFTHACVFHSRVEKMWNDTYIVEWVENVENTTNAPVMEIDLR